MELAGYIGALIMGLVLGVIGGGGSILTVPILVYLLGVDAVIATGYSLFIVGTTALFGGASHMRQGNVHWPSVIWFGAPSIVAVFATRKWIMPALPDIWFSVDGVIVTKGIGLLLVFALLMVAASVSMIRKPAAARAPVTRTRAATLLLAATEGVAVGVLTGLVGAGGGFLIIPALVLFGGLGMKQAIGTSLIIIAAKSLIGFSGDLLGGSYMNWPMLLGFSGVAIMGILAGSSLSKRMSNERLKPAFGWFVLVMGIGMIAKELLGA